MGLSAIVPMVPVHALARDGGIAIFGKDPVDSLSPVGKMVDWLLRRRTGRMSVDSHGDGIAIRVVSSSARIVSSSA